VVEGLPRCAVTDGIAARAGFWGNETACLIMGWEGCTSQAIVPQGSHSLAWDSSS